jgi:HSP20 family molecular chaperone IbpA
MTSTSTNKLDELQLVNAFDSYWNEARFQHGWATPSVSRCDAKSFMQQAATIINNICHKHNITFTAEVLNAASEAANAFFTNLTYMPSSDAKRFVKELVTAVVQGIPKLSNISEHDVLRYITSAMPNDDGMRRLTDIGRCRIQITEMLDKMNTLLPQLKEQGALSSWRSLVQSCSIAEQRMQILQSEQEESREQIAVPTLRLPVKGKKHKKRKQVDEIKSDVQQQPAQVEQQPAQVEQQSAQVEQQSAQVEQQPAQVEQQSAQFEQQPAQVEQQPAQVEQAETKAEPVEQAETKAEPVEQAETKAEPEPEPTHAVEIKKVASFVDDIVPQLHSLKEQATKLDYDDLSKHPNVAYDYVSRLHHNSLQYSEDLMKSLLKLDSLVCNMKEKPLRKSIVQKIQTMLDMVDEVNNDLHDIQEKLNEKRMAEKQAEEERLAEEKRKADQEKQVMEKKFAEEKALELQKLEKEKEQKMLEERRRLEEQQRRLADQQKQLEQRLMEHMRRQEESVDDDESDEDEIRSQYASLSRVWPNLKWEPRTDVQEVQDAYVVHILAPAMSKDNFDIGMDNGHVLRVRATKVPSLDDLKHLRDEARTYGVGDINDSHVVQLASGRFGTMRLSYTVPDDVDDDRISAKYDNGVLTLILKKKPIRRIRQPTYDWLW